jgi:hypothetical protein
MIGKFVIVRSRDQGVVCGILETLALGGAQAVATLRDARQIHGWRSGEIKTLFEASLRGFDIARISEAVEEMILIGACGVLPCTPEAEENLRQSRWNQPYNYSAQKIRKTSAGK